MDFAHGGWAEPLDGAAGDGPFSTVAPEPLAVGHDQEQGHFEGKKTTIYPF